MSDVDQEEASRISILPEHQQEQQQQSKRTKELQQFLAAPDQEAAYAEWCAQYYFYFEHYWRYYNELKAHSLNAARRDDDSGPAESSGVSQ